MAEANSKAVGRAVDMGFPFKQSSTIVPFKGITKVQNCLEYASFCVSESRLFDPQKSFFWPRKSDFWPRKSVFWPQKSDFWPRKSFF
jgi:hypothetical protein